MRFFIVLFIFVFHANSYAQNGSNFGFGASIGLKTPNSEAGFLAEYKLKKIVDVYGGVSFGKYNGFGLTLGTDVFILRKNWQPYVGIGYNYQSGDRFYVGQTGVNRTDFKVNFSNSLIGTLGIRWIVLFDDKTANGFMVVSPFISYKQATSPHKVIYLSGVQDASIEQKINNRIGSGFGVGIKVLYFINRNREDI